MTSQRRKGEVFLAMHNKYQGIYMYKQNVNKFNNKGPEVVDFERKQ
jgi:hypothetical protein